MLVGNRLLKLVLFFCIYFMVLLMLFSVNILHKYLLNCFCDIELPIVLQLHLSHFPKPAVCCLVFMNIFPTPSQLLDTIPIPRTEHSTTCVSSRHSRKCVTLLKLRMELKTNFSFFKPILSANYFLKYFEMPYILSG